MPAKPIQISPHARFEMKRRGIRQADITRMIRSPGQVIPTRKGRYIYQGLIGRSQHLLLRVVVKEVAEAYRVVTAYKTSQIAKYWRTS